MARYKRQKPKQPHAAEMAALCCAAGYKPCEVASVRALRGVHGFELTLHRDDGGIHQKLVEEHRVKGALNGHGDDLCNHQGFTVNPNVFEWTAEVSH